MPAVGVNENGSGEVFRLNLESGQFLRAFEIDVGDESVSNGARALQGEVGAGAVNVAAVAEESHNLLAFGTSLGTVEFWDSRSRQRVGLLQNPSSRDFVNGKQEITALEFNRSGLGLAKGSSTGLIHLYDLRSPNPILKKDQGYGYPIQDIIYLSPSSSNHSQVLEPKILSSDKRIIKIWDPQDGSPWTSVEPAVDINSVAWCKDSGMLLTANEGRQQHSFFIPQLGPAPKWCSFLDNLVEEMAEDPNDPNAFQSQKVGEIYDNYKFLTMQQLEALNLSHLVGTTSLLRPYMHGYFVAQRLYEEAKMIADPFVWEEQHNKRVKEKIEAERASRIRGNKKVTAKVNKRLAEKMMERQEREERRQARKVLQDGGDEPTQPEATAPETEAEAVEEKQMVDEKPDGNLLTDPRFAKLFQDEDFAIDEQSHEFKQLNPSTKPTPLEPTNGKERKLTAVEEEALEDAARSSSSGDSAGDESDREIRPPPKSSQNGRISSSAYRKSGHRPQQPVRMEVSSSKKPAKIRDLPFGERIAKSSQRGSRDQLSSAVVGEKQISFAPEKKTKKRHDDESNQDKGRKRDRQRDKERRSASGNVFRGM